MSDLDLLNEGSVSEQILQGLNDSQKEVVSAPRTNMLIVAGAGTGKTRVLVSRIAWLLLVENIPSRSIMAVTFTNKAALEMRTRISTIVGGMSSKHLWAGTFHSTCLRLLRAYSEQANLRPGFTVLDTDSQTSLIKRIMTELGYSVKENKPSDISSRISSFKEKGMRAKQVEALSYKNTHRSQYLDMITRIYHVYETTCQNENSVDFSELLLRTVELLRNHPEIQQLQHSRFREILIDEFQDTNSIQYEFVKLMAGKDTRVLVVGDDDQSIYGWRGADYTNMKKFLSDYENVKQVLLAINYRSSQRILDTANALIQSNYDRLMEKVLQGSSGIGEQVTILNCGNNRAEENKVAYLISQLQDSGEKLSDIAILYRNNYLSAGIEQCLTKRHIPFTIYGGQKFFERAEILDTLAYLRVILNEDDDTATLRIINVPARKIGPKVVDSLRKISKERNCSLMKSIRLLKQYVSEGGTDKELTALYKKTSPFLELIDSLNVKRHEMKLHDFANDLLQDTGLYTFYQQKDIKEGKSSTDEHSRYNNLGMFVTNITDFEKDFEKIENDETGEIEERDINDTTDPLLTYLSNVTLVSTGEIDEDGSSGSSSQDSVNLMTIHSSKGLEFKYVFIIGFEETILPSNRSVEAGAAKIEEERRLAYVGITRAKYKLYLSYSQSRYLFNNSFVTGASTFLRDIVNKCSKAEDKPYQIEKVPSLF
ncbi:MAG: ATP-dependent helicase [Succinivibrio sp.]